MTKYTVHGTDQFGNPVSEIIETGKPSYPLPEEMIDQQLAEDRFPNIADSFRNII